MDHLAGQPSGGASWVPERASATPQPPGPSGNAPTVDGSFFAPPGSTPGRHLKPWQIAGALALVFVPLVWWFTASLTDRATDPAVGEPGVAASVSPSSPTATRTGAVTTSGPSGSASASLDPTTDPLPPILPPDASGDFPTLPSVTVPDQPTAPTARGASPTNKPVLTAPPSLLPAPTVSITAIPPGAKTIRFEAQAAGDAKIEVSLSDATHQRFDYPLQKAPLAFEVPVGSNLSNSDYFSLRVRSPYDSSATRPDVACRILVDGVVVTSQQGQGYVTCYISPYYDVRRT
ncbi:hypothetical protein BA895_15970 [Humibacillus sp. DSM 29435]|nr:hypothetical protein BA895_15970 [Humibacillus sp. DSM 29435]